MKAISYTKCLIYTLLMMAGVSANVYSQLKVYPPHWWKGMENDTLELLLYSEKPLTGTPELNGKVHILANEIAANPHYAYIKLLLSEHTTGEFEIKARGKKLMYQIHSRSDYSPRGLNPTDVMYLITPDRFANGDLSNDRVKGMNEKVYSRDSIYGRHGGDIQGIIDHVNYIKEMGFNSLWICPLLENNEFKASYHGYAITDHYTIDPRFGTNKIYGELTDQLHKKDMKMVMDVVYNHFGSQHHLYLDPPDSGFFNFHPEFTRTNYRAVTIYDPYASEADKAKFADGWFDGHMPDVNQRDPHMANFLIQNSIWWIEEFGIDAFRIDTYTYPDQKFMAELSRRIRKEYPGFYLFGETWVHFPEIQNYFVEDNRYNPIATHLNNVTDFQVAFAIHETLTKPQEWTGGVAKLYYRLSADYMNADPYTLVTFVDNHDLGRIYGTLGEDMDRLKQALGLIFTLRGIPCMYYGTEVLMKETENHGVIREDFPGGWPGDPVDKFSTEGRSEEEDEIHDYISQLLSHRAKSEALTTGKMLHFVPEDDVYVYFRITGEETYMMILNADGVDSKTLDLTRFSEVWPLDASGKDVISGKEINGAQLRIPAKGFYIIKKS